MSKNIEDNLDDHEIFMAAMKDVTPIQSKQQLPLFKPARARLISTTPAETTAVFPLSDHCAIDITNEQFLSYCKAGVQPHYFRKLKQGRIPVDAEIDLHGCQIDQARNLLQQFIANALANHYRCIRIIHGKGYRNPSQTPLLKSKVYTWLMQLPDILAFSSCPPRQGGTGAVYVLLRKIH